MTVMASSISTRPMATWFPFRKAGSGHPHMLCPMDTYISSRRKPSEAISLRFKTGVSRSASASSPAAAVFSAPLRLAPYPAASTAAMMLCSSAVPSTPMELVSRLTEQASTPGTPDTAFSTRAEHAAQLIPVTLYCFTVVHLLTSSASGALSATHPRSRRFRHGRH